MNDNKNMINENELAGVSGGATTDGGQISLTKSEIDSIKNIFSKYKLRNRDFSEAYEEVCDKRVPSFNMHRKCNGSPLLNDYNFRPICFNIWNEM